MQYPNRFAPLACRSIFASIMIATLIAGSIPATAMADNRPEMPVPPSISEQGQDYYRNWRPRPPSTLDYTEPRVMENVRRMLNKIFLANAEKIGIEYELEAVDAGGAKAYWVRLPIVQRTDKAIIYLHGGGFILGSARANLGTALRVGMNSAVPILSVEYRLAPEDPFPAGLEDAVSAYQWLLENGYDAGDVAVFGDSAGGGLSLSLALAAKDRGLPVPVALALLSPGVDRTRSGDTYLTLADVDPILVLEGPGQKKLYTGEHDPGHPLISPLFADLTGMPPTLIQVGGRELLLSDSLRLARAARAAGVDVTLDVWDGMWHVWQDTPDLPEAETACREIAAFLVSHLDR